MKTLKQSARLGGELISNLDPNMVITLDGSDAVQIGELGVDTITYVFTKDVESDTVYELNLTFNYYDTYTITVPLRLTHRTIPYIEDQPRIGSVVWKDFIAYPNMVNMVPFEVFDLEGNPLTGAFTKEITPTPTRPGTGLLYSCANAVEEKDGLYYLAVSLGHLEGQVAINMTLSINGFDFVVDTKLLDSEGRFPTAGLITVENLGTPNADVKVKAQLSQAIFGENGVETIPYEGQLGSLINAAGPYEFERDVAPPVTDGSVTVNARSIGDEGSWIARYAVIEKDGLPNGYVDLIGWKEPILRRDSPGPLTVKLADNKPAYAKVQLRSAFKPYPDASLHPLVFSTDDEKVTASAFEDYNGKWIALTHNPASASNASSPDKNFNIIVTDTVTNEIVKIPVVGKLFATENYLPKVTEYDGNMEMTHFQPTPTGVVIKDGDKILQPEFASLSNLVYPSKPVDQYYVYSNYFTKVWTIVNTEETVPENKVELLGFKYAVLVDHQYFVLDVGAAVTLNKDLTVIKRPTIERLKNPQVVRPNQELLVHVPFSDGTPEDFTLLAIALDGDVIVADTHGEGSLMPGVTVPIAQFRVTGNHLSGVSDFDMLVVYHGITFVYTVAGHIANEGNPLELDPLNIYIGDNDQEVTREVRARRAKVQNPGNNQNNYEYYTGTITRIGAIGTDGNTIPTLENTGKVEITPYGTSANKWTLHWTRPATEPDPATITALFEFDDKTKSSYLKNVINVARLI